MPWTKGQSGNPGGVPKEIAHLLKEARTKVCRASPAIVDEMLRIAFDESRDLKHRIPLLVHLDKRALGLPPQTINLEDTSDISPEKLTTQQLQDKMRAIMEGRKEEVITAAYRDGSLDGILSKLKDAKDG